MTTLSIPSPVLSIGGTALLALLVKALLGLRPPLGAEETGLALSDHGEAGYHFDEAGG